MAYFVETAKLVLFNKKPREINILGASCCKCGASNGQKLITREERVGCLMSPFTYCKPCLTEVEQERSAYLYQRSNFCNNCDVKFEKPYRKNRKIFHISGGFNSYWINLCPACYETEVERTPKGQEDEDLWSKDSGTDDKRPWQELPLNREKESEIRTFSDL